MKISRRIKSIFSLGTLSGTILLSSCHTPLYNAAARGDMIAVERHINSGGSVNKTISNAHLLWEIPTTAVTATVDIAIAYGTLFGWFCYVDNPLPTTMAMYDGHFSLPIDAAYDNRHYDIVEKLVKAGSEIPTRLKPLIKQHWDGSVTIIGARPKPKPEVITETKIIYVPQPTSHKPGSSKSTGTNNNTNSGSGKTWTRPQ